MLPAPSSALRASTGAFAGHQLAVLPGTRLHALTSDGALRDRTRAWTHGQGACFATNGGALCRGRGTIQRAWLEKYGGTR